MLPYAVTIFVSAFLLFQVQPVIAKMILPWFGGSAMVWTSCMLFFQLALLAGYAYAHGITRWPLQRQVRVHSVLLGFSLLSLPIIPKAFLKPHGGDNPLLGILTVLAITVGLPYFLLSTTGPLMQAWYVARHPGRLPYRLFALSNAGSLLALLAYPILVEPEVSLRFQGIAWSVLYAGFALCCLYVAWKTTGPVSTDETAPLGDDFAELGPAVGQKILWVALAACASALLLSVTSFLAQNVAAIPFLWILPLSLYLLSFMLCFDSDRWYKVKVFPYLLALALGGMAYPIWKDLDTSSILGRIFGFNVALFIACMFCHGEIARRRPNPRYLTGFYLMISLGGALGGLMISVAAPLLLAFHWELSVALAATAIVALLSLYQRSWATDILWVGMSLFLVFTVARDVRNTHRENVYASRNFYGALRVRENGSDFDGSRVRMLINGTINHGAQYVATQRSRIPTTYYGERSGVGVSILSRRHPGMKVGIIGLGAGTLVTYGEPGDTYKVYEINTLVEDLARSWFTYLRDGRAKTEVVIGDARLSLESEAPNGFDVLAVDAFSSDAIPVHLLTSEAFRLYFSHIRHDGIIAVHVSNKYLNLLPVVDRIAKAQGKALLFAAGREPGTNEQYDSDWVLVANSSRVFETPAFRTLASPYAPQPDAPRWTDDYSNLYKILR